MILEMSRTQGKEISVTSCANYETRVLKHTLLFVLMRFRNAKLLIEPIDSDYCQRSHELALKLLGVNNQKFFPMKIIAWNVRGAAHPEFKKAIKDMVKNHNLMMFILETRLPVTKMDEIKLLLKFYYAHGIDSNGLSGGIWMMWDSARISADIRPHGTQAIHAFVKVNSNPQFSDFTWLISGVYASTCF